jgi:uncharacterized protein (TIGR03089 family)
MTISPGQDVIPVSALIAEYLRRRVRDRGADPLLTYYDLDSGERTELSATTFANWVNKTSNLLVDGLALDAEDGVTLALAETHPGHWVTLIWELACWQVGAEVRIGRSGPAPVLVVGPDTGWSALRGTTVVFCSLHPLALPGPDAGKGEVLDYTLEVRGQADQFPATRQPDDGPAWHDAERAATQAELVGSVTGPAARRLVLPTDAWATAQQALVTPLVTGGSVVVVAGTTTPDQLDRIRTSERVTEE